jgi:hypothetical protein
VEMPYRWRREDFTALRQSRGDLLGKERSR